MKKLVSILLIFAAIAFTSCEGPIGPPGMDGEELMGTVFEIEGDFRSSNNYKLYFEFPGKFKVYDTDVVLVYMLWEVDGGKDVWRLMPQTIILSDGILQYNFDYTFSDVQIFLEGTTDFNKLRPAESDDQVFRIVVLPADFIAKKSVDITNINTILNSPVLKLNTIKTVKSDAVIK